MKLMVWYIYCIFYREWSSFKKNIKLLRRFTPVNIKNKGISSVNIGNNNNELQVSLLCNTNDTVILPFVRRHHLKVKKKLKVLLLWSCGIWFPSTSRKFRIPQSKGMRTKQDLSMQGHDRPAPRDQMRNLRLTGVALPAEDSVLCEQIFDWEIPGTAGGRETQKGSWNGRRLSI